MNQYSSPPYKRSRQSYENSDYDDRRYRQDSRYQTERCYDREREQVSFRDAETAQERFRITDAYIYDTKPSARSTAFDIKDGLTYKKLQMVVNDCVQDCGGHRDVDAKLVYKRLAPYVPYYGTLVRSLSVTNIILSTKLSVTNALLDVNHGREDDRSNLLTNVLFVADQTVSDGVSCVPASMASSDLVFIRTGNPMPCAICNKKIMDNHFSATPLTSCTTIMHESCFVRASKTQDISGCPCGRCDPAEHHRGDYLRYVFKFEHPQRSIVAVAGPVDGNPFCNDCLRNRGNHIRMVTMKNQKTGSQFYGCPNWSQYKCRAMYSNQRQQQVPDHDKQIVDTDDHKPDRRPNSHRLVDTRIYQTEDKRRSGEAIDGRHYQDDGRHYQTEDKRRSIDTRDGRNYPTEDKRRSIETRDARHHPVDARHRSDSYDD